VSDKKEKIREAAIELFARDGFHETTTDRIAKRAGVAVGTIYNYFGNKRDVLDYIFLTEHSKRQDIHDEVSNVDTHPLDKLEMIIRRHFEEVKENPEMVTVILREGHNVGEKVKELEGLKKFLENIISEGIDSGHFQRIDAAICSSMIFGAIRAIMRDFSEAEESAKETPELFDQALEQLMMILKKGLDDSNNQ